jgi:hypothetical protein
MRMAVADKNTIRSFRPDSPQPAGKEVAAKHYLALAAEIRSENASKWLEHDGKYLIGNLCLKK